VRGKKGDDGGFGLDAYEPEFFNSQGWWAEQNEVGTGYTVTLTIPADADYTRVYYFCHIHAHMSAEIEIKGSTAPTKTTLNKAVLGTMTERAALNVFADISKHEQAAPSAFDQVCGTTEAGDYVDAGALPEMHFLCGDAKDTAYAKCFEAIDRRMHEKMAVGISKGDSKFATFARQMIPHHQNAVEMSKIALKHSTAADYPDEEDQDQEWATNLMHEIISAQNFQIQGMQGWLDANAAMAGPHEECYHLESSSEHGGMAHASSEHGGMVHASSEEGGFVAASPEEARSSTSSTGGTATESS